MNLSKILFKRILLLILIIMLFVLFIFYFSFKNQIKNSSTPIIENSIVIPNQETIFLAQDQIIQEEKTSSNFTDPITQKKQISSNLTVSTKQKQEQESSNLTVSTKQKQESGLPIIVGNPVRLRIPSINVDSAIEYVGLTSAGAMDSPLGPAEAGWYMLGPRPGEEGSAVIAGHSGWRNNIPAVFDDLYKVKIGDKIYVKDDTGATITFVVRELRTYKPTADAFDVFSSSDGKAHLNLITCTGFWNKILKSRSDRLVVFTDRE